MMKGAQTPSQSNECHKEPPKGGSEGMKIIFTDSLLESRPFSTLVWDRECGQSKDKWGKLHGPPRQWCTGEYHHTEVCKGTFPTSGTNNQPHGFQSCICIGLGNTYTRLSGYVVIQVQVDGVWGYDKDQISLIIPDHSNFATRVPIILGTPTIGRVVNMMREVEMDALAMPWANARAAHLLAVRRMMPVEGGNLTRRRGMILIKIVS